MKTINEERVREVALGLTAMAEEMGLSNDEYVAMMRQRIRGMYDALESATLKIEFVRAMANVFDLPASQFLIWLRGE
jgi:hypothetical protein